MMTLPAPFAYIDPGTGAIALQVLMALFLGAGIFFRRILTAPFAFLFRKHHHTQSSAAASGDEQDLRDAA